MRIFRKRRDTVPRGSVVVQDCTDVQIGPNTVSNVVRGTVPGNVVQARDIDGDIDFGQATTPE